MPGTGNIFLNPELAIKAAITLREAGAELATVVVVDPE